MDWLQFLASIVDSLAWPAIIGVAAYLLRKPLLELLPSLRQLRYKEFDIQFGEQLEKLEDQIKGEPPLEAIAPPSDKQQLADKRFEDLAQTSPNAAVIEAWINIESELEELVWHKFQKKPHPRSIRNSMRALQSQGVISKRLESLLNDLRVLRNEAVHPRADRQVSLEEARRYKELVDQVRRELQDLRE